MSTTTFSRWLYEVDDDELRYGAPEGESRVRHFTAKRVALRHARERAREDVTTAGTVRVRRIRIGAETLSELLIRALDGRGYVLAAEVVAEFPGRQT